MKTARSLPCLLLLACTSWSQYALDSRFGTVGSTGGKWQWFRQYNQDYANLPAAPAKADPKRLYTVGKLDDPTRVLPGGGDWCTDQSKPTLLNCDRIKRSEADHRERYAKVFEYDKAGIRSLVRRFNKDYKNVDSEYGYNGAEKLHIVVGNEPNFHPYVHPGAFAAAFKQYYDFIKGPTPGGLGCASCVIHNGAIILGDFTVNAGPETLVEAALVIELIAASSAANAMNDRLDHFTWTWKFLDRLIVGLGGRFDIFNVHPYEVNYEWNGLYVEEDGLANLNRLIKLVQGGTFLGKTLVPGKTFCYDQDGDGVFTLHKLTGPRIEITSHIPVYFRSKTQCENASATLELGRRYAFPFPWTVPNPVVWADEFGVLSTAASEALVNTHMERYVNGFKANPYVHRWFWFKNFGEDAKFDVLEGCNVDPLQACNLRGRLGRFGLCTSESCANLTGVGQKYLSLQDQAFQNYNYPRLSFDAPTTADYLKMPRWTNDPSNMPLLWDFSIDADVSAWHTGSRSLYRDGFRFYTTCVSYSIGHTLTENEIKIANDANFFVVERGTHNYYDPGTAFTIFYRNKSTKAHTGSKLIGNSASFSTYVNELAAQGQPFVLNFKNHLPADQELYRIEQNFLTLGGCQDGNYPHDYGRAYFSVNNPVPSTMSGTGVPRYTGVLLEMETEAAKEVFIPINLNTTYCTSCALTLDAASLAKGMVVEGQYVKWKPMAKDVGLHAGTLTAKLNGSTLASKPFRVRVKRATSMLSAIHLLLE